jgi:pimeloyl-ACP methyl ester carboxylesterase
VRLSARKLAVTLLAATPLALAGPRPAAALADLGSVAFAPCGNSNDFACGHLTVPIDPSRVTPGTITLAIRRHRAPVGNPSSAVVALAGGPGQSAIPFAEDFSETLGSIISTRDLIVFDQRGTGLSHPLSCHSLEHPGSFHSFRALINSCAEQIGPTRAFYTTPDSVADIEAIRQAGGYEKLVLYGTSYGTKVALQYAEEYPQHVEALILDSVVTPNGPDPLDRPTFAAIPRVLRQLCAFHDCAHITSNPVRDLARLVARMRRQPLRARVIDGYGHAHSGRISSDDLLGILLEGDFNPILRAEFPAAVHSAADGDTAALARLLNRGVGDEASEAGEGIDVPLYYDTTCEEEPFGWSRSASPATRIAEATARIDALPASSFAPFTHANAVDLSGLRQCAFWPFATPAPPVVNGPLPNVPTLILSGAEDLRTPTSGALAVAAQIPDSHLLVVPNTGHSVLGTEPTACAREALHALFAGRPIRACLDTPPPPFLRPTPLPPERLSDLRPAKGYTGRTGRTLRAIALTLADFARQLLLQLLETVGSAETISSSPSLRSGGLRAGWAQLAGGVLRLQGYSYIPGVAVSGTVKAETVTLRISGFAAAHGILRLGSHRALVGRLDGQSVRLATNPSALQAQAARRGAQAAPAPHGAARGLPVKLQSLLDHLPAGIGTELAALPQLWSVRQAARL